MKEDAKTQAEYVDVGGGFCGALYEPTGRIDRISHAYLAMSRHHHLAVKTSLSNLSDGYSIWGYS